MSFTLRKGFSIVFIFCTASCESLPNLHTTYIGRSRGTSARVNDGSSMRLVNGMSNVQQALEVDVLLELLRLQIPNCVSSRVSMRTCSWFLSLEYS